jgi:hypothetical protein
MDTPVTVPVKVGERMIDMRPPTDTQIIALLDFDRQATLLDKMSDGPEKNVRSVALARRSLILIEKLIATPSDWDWLMDEMMAASMSWEEFNEIPERLFVALEGLGNRASRRSTAKPTRTRKA